MSRLLKATNRLRWVKTDEYKNQPVALTWEWMKSLARGKSVASVPTKYKLQQLWQGSDGSDQWEDIEVKEN